MLRSEEWPVTTRFWLFEDVDVLQTGVQHQHANNQKRTTRVRKYLEDEGARFQLALAFLCLRLTSLATSIAGQKNATAPDTQPLPRRRSAFH